jgi:hypothetical protein
MLYGGTMLRPHEMYWNDKQLGFGRMAVRGAGGWIMHRRLNVWTVAIILVVSGGADAWAADDCKPIRFDANRVSATIHGEAPPEDVVCYTLTTGRGQRAALKVTAGRNTIFSIEGLVDARNAYDFTTEQKTYRILVGQLLRAVAPEAFAISVSVR